MDRVIGKGHLVGIVCGVNTHRAGTANAYPGISASGIHRSAYGNRRRIQTVKGSAVYA